MKTTENVARVAAMQIRTAVMDIRRSTHGYAQDATHQNHVVRHDALDSLDEIANKLEEYAGPGAAHADQTEVAG